MAYVPNHCWGFRRPDSQSRVSCSGSLPQAHGSHSLTRCIKVQRSRLLSEQASKHCKRTHSHRHISAAATSDKQKSSRGRGAPSPQTTAPDDGTGRLKDFPAAPVVAAPQLETPEPDGEDDDVYETQLPDDDIRSGGGYTPFEELDFSEEDITHEMTVHVAAPRSKCFQIWHNRLNYLEWFYNIGQLIGHREEPNLVSMFIFYQWGTTPMLELYTTLARSQVEENELILEENVDGMDFVAGVLFADADDEGASTYVTLRVGYYLPEQLNEFVGPVAIYGDVNDILEDSMLRMKVFVESVDLEELLAAREEERQEQDQVFTNHSDQFHAKFGSPETIYNQARQAASDYLAESGVEDLDEEEQEAAVAEALSEEEVDDAPEFDADQFTPVDEMSPPDYLSYEDIAHETPPMQGPGVRQYEEADEADMANISSQAAATEEQAAANLSSSHQQDVGQFDEVQASRASPQGTLSVSDSQDVSNQLDADLFSSQLQQHGSEQQVDSVNQTEAASDKKAAPKPKNKGGRPKKSTDDGSKAKKKPGRPKKADQA